MAQFGMTPLHVTAMAAHLDILRNLIKSGADLSKRDSSGRLWLASVPREVESSDRCALFTVRSITSSSQSG